ncbi:metadherin a isoform X2 [Nelusetta ayraudi]|uniref:metadherin a isoform X2 n=1 Tax=Nelusetta ayraudi TaxID=303726 RepID=UPI003F6FCE8D
MAGDLRGFALQKAELLCGRLREMLSSGQGYLRTQFGVDLGLEPELYPTWVVLSTAAVGLLLLLLFAVSWAAVCGALLAGKRRRSPADRDVCEPAVKATLSKSAKAEEQQQQQQQQQPPKKKSKKKAADKGAQPNGQPVSIVQEEVQVTKVDTKPSSKPSQQSKTEKVQEVQAPVQLKKDKKKARTEVKPVQLIITDDGKEPDEGAWETKVSNREKKKQQRRKDKGPEDSGWVEAPRSHQEAPAGPVSAGTKRNRNHESLPSRATEKGVATSGKGLSGWREELSVNNGGGWTDASLKTCGQFGNGEGTKWSSVHTAVHYRAPPKRQSWAQERQAWSGVDAHIKTDLNSVPLSMLRRNPAEPAPSSAERQWASQPDPDDEWSGFNGMAAGDSSSDWNAPAEHWGNCEEGSAGPEPPARGQSVANKASDDKEDVDDPCDGAAKSKKRRKKKKKAEEEEGGAESQARSAAAPQELLAPSSRKQQSSIIAASSSHKKSQPAAEPPKAAQKKKARRET